MLTIFETKSVRNDVLFSYWFGQTMAPDGIDLDYVRLHAMTQRANGPDLSPFNFPFYFPRPVTPLLLRIPPSAPPRP